MSRTATREGVLAGAATAPTRALSGDDAAVELQGEWERVRRQRLALEKQQQRARDADGEAEEGELVEDDTEQAALVALQAPPSTDPFACCCRPFKLKKLGQSYVLRERRVVERGRVTNELVLVGPHWVGVIVTLTIVLGCTALFLHQQCTLLPWYYSVITLGLCAMTLHYLYGVACKDPGIVLSETTKKKTFKPKQDEDTSRDMDDHRTTIAVDDDDNQQDASDDDELESGSMARVRGGATRQTLVPQSSQNAWVPPPSYYARFSPRARYCDICEVSQDAYTEHCDDCGVCIEDYDHHCPWMGKCIGKKNMYAFKMFNVSWVLYVVFVLFVSIQNVDWGDMAVQRLHRLSTGEWVPLGTTEKPH